MRQRLGIIITIILAIGVLVVVNSLAYVSEDKKVDSEISPNRSTYNAGPTGTRALFDLLNESGYPVIRWRESPERLLATGGKTINTFVFIGDPKVPFAEEEITSLLLWVEGGGRLVIVDRRPDDELLPASGEWKVTTEFLEFPGAVDAASAEQMTDGVKSLKPAQPTRLTRELTAVKPSRFYSAIKFFPVSKTEKQTSGETSNQADTDESFWGDEDEPTPPAAEKSSTLSPAPVVHLATSRGPLLIDYPHGMGRITLLSDPFIVANVGIGLEDNLQLAMNLLSPADGLIAFDEFHQGHGATQNAFVGYFQGTPVLAICGQIVLVILLILWTRGRRFARPLPLPRVDRRSSLEFVASMAELQQRAHSYDLAIENIYSRTRRVLARYAGVDYNSSRREIAERVASRSTIDAHQLETLMRQSEEAINGQSISERQSIHLVKRLREVEAALGLRLRSREIKQARS